jgi:alpha-1,2-mannosyltransferase
MMAGGSNWSAPKWFGPMPGRREAHAMAWMALAAGVILCVASVVLGFQGRTFMGRALGGDFIGFYTIGKILNTYPAARIYDLDLAVRLQHEILPSMDKTQMLVFGQAPYIAWLFRPFALLPYAWAYVAWLGFSAALYIAGLRLLFGAVRLTQEDRKTGFLLALSWAPFLFETWIGGQMAAVVFFIWALFLWCLKNDWRFLAGLALSLCLFKPTLVALPAAMLFIGARRWRVAGGLAVGAAGMALISIATVGLEGCRAWAGMLAFIAQAATGAGDAWHRAKYVDMAAFFHLLLGTQAIAAAILMIFVAVAAVGALGLVWWRAGALASNELWAATLCCTLVVNQYATIYDTVLAVAAVALLAAKRAEWPDKDREAFAGWLVLLYMIPWITQSFAEFLHLQLITVILAGFGVWALRLANRSLGLSGTPKLTHSKTTREESTTTSQLQPWAAGRFKVRSRGLP